MTNFHDLYQKYAADVHRFAFWLSGDAAEAADLTSETFMRVWVAKDDLRAQTVKAYLFTICRHLYLQQRKRQDRHQEIPPDLEDTNPRPDHLAETRSELDAVLAVLNSLPEIDRSVLIMRAQDGLSYEEIAELHGITVAAAKVKVHRARLKLARLRSEGDKL
jgi:RNA polymerase sigma-70 factor (ECF subfamily)